MTPALSGDIRTFVDDLRFATIATTDPDGAPRQAVVWYTVEGDEIVFNSRTGRRWPTNLLRDGRVSVAIPDGEDGYRWVGLTGTVRPVTDQPTAQADIAAMARRYHAANPAHAEELIESRFQPQQRVSFRLAPDQIHDHLDGD